MNSFGADLDRPIGEREGQRAILERLRDRGRDHQPDAASATNSSSRTGARSGSSQLVTQALSIQAHHTASIRIAVCSAPSGVRCSQQPVRKLRHREHEHEVEEQFDEGDAAVPVADAEVVGVRCEHHAAPRALS